MKRSIITIEDLSNEEILRLFKLADEYLDKGDQDSKTHRLQRSLSEARDQIAATLFFEPSTRTRLSFETAMYRLGGQVIVCADPKTMSSAKGETLADTIRVVQSYADIIILRHPFEGAARVAYEYAEIPVINAGDGSHEHPTQTLCDLYTLYRQNTKLADLNVLVSGDLKNGRTVHSLVYALARFGARIILAPAKGLELPEHVARRLETQYNSIALDRNSIKDLPDHVDVVYVTPKEPHSTALVAGIKLQLDAQIDLSKVDVYYVTRLQTERLARKKSDNAFPVIDRSFLSEERYADTRVMHPLPRVGELGYDLDQDPRGAYFEQTAYGVPIRMALISALLRIKPILNETNESRYSLYTKADGLKCKNPKCILTGGSERRYLTPKMWVVDSAQASLFQPLMLRCVYCEVDYKPRAVADTRNMQYTTEVEGWHAIPQEYRLFFESIPSAEKKGFKNNNAKDFRQASSDKVKAISKSKGVA